MKHEFSGNVRELENMIQSAVVLCRSDYITQKCLPPQMKIKSERAVLDPHQLEHAYEAKMKAFEKEMIAEALAQTSGNQSAAARLLKITERHLRSRLDKLELKQRK